MNTSEVLDRAADLIEEHGWGKGADTWDIAAEEGLCIEGALMAALGENPWHSQPKVNVCPAGLAVRDYLGLPAWIPFSAGETDGLWRWNDTKAESQGQVVAVLRAAALIERAKENTSLKAKEEAHV